MHLKILRSFIFFIIKSLPALRCNRMKIFLLNKAGHRLGKSVVFASSAKILGDFSAHIGDKTFIGHETLIIGGNTDIFIGKNCDISSKVSLVMGSHMIGSVNDRSAGEGFSKSIIIEDGVWIGFGATVLPGVVIGQHAVIGAGSIVNRNIPPFTIAAGNPCRIIKRYDPVACQWTRV